MILDIHNYSLMIPGSILGLPFFHHFGGFGAQSRAQSLGFWPPLVTGLETR